MKGEFEKSVDKFGEFMKSLSTQELAGINLISISGVVILAIIYGIIFAITLAIYNWAGFLAGTLSMWILTSLVRNISKLKKDSPKTEEEEEASGSID